jgi:glucose/arabinose dehydrogenase
MVHLTHAGDGSGTVFVVLQPGQVMVFSDEQSTQSANVFLDIRDRVNDGGNEEGLLGLAFDPEYGVNGHLYVSYTASDPRRSVVSRFTASAAGDVADAGSELVILEVAQPFANHNGGTIAFGADGMLYIGLGDGGSGGDPLGSGQDVSTLLGSMLRIDVSAATLAEPYRIPVDNPFAASAAGERPEIWAFGLRNPWKFSFDQATGDMWAGDVGQGSYEEVDIIHAGGNYGWNVMEGLHCYPPPSQGCDTTGLELPITEYDHSQGCSITGGHVYRGERLPGLAGHYIYGDYCSGRIWAVRYDGDSITQNGLIVDSALMVTSFGTDESGNLYVLASDGHIYRFVAPVPPEPVPALSFYALVLLAAALMRWCWKPSRRLR